MEHLLTMSIEALMQLLWKHLHRGLEKEVIRCLSTVASLCLLASAARSNFAMSGSHFDLVPLQIHAD